MKQKTYRLSSDRKQQILKRISRLLEEREEIVFAYLFGSFSDDLPLHDIDVGIFLTGRQEGPAFRYAFDLSHLLSEELRIPVEVTVLNDAPFTFVYHVIRGTLLLERDEALHAMILEDTVRRYLDIRPLLRRSTREAFAA